MRALSHQLEALCGKDGYFLSLENDSYTLIIEVTLTAKSNFDDVKTLLDRTVPANLVIDLSLKYNQNSTFAKFTHVKLAKYTYNELRNEAMNHGECNT